VGAEPDGAGADRGGVGLMLFRTDITIEGKPATITFDLGDVATVVEAQDRAMRVAGDAKGVFVTGDNGEPLIAPLSVFVRLQCDRDGPSIVLHDDPREGKPQEATAFLDAWGAYVMTQLGGLAWTPQSAAGDEALCRDNAALRVAFEAMKHEDTPAAVKDTARRVIALARMGKLQ
jgi:hypothetical protein